MPKVVQLDENRIAHVDGRPFFLIGARHMPEGGTPAMLAEAGFNAYRRLAFGTETSGGEPLPDPDLGIHFWSYIYDRAAFGRSSDYRGQLDEHVRQVRDHPAMLCYENFNEVAMLWRSDTPKAEPDELDEGMRLLRELDPDHPVWLAHSCERTVDTLARYNDSMDIVGCNPYPIIPQGLRQHVGIRADGRIVDCPDQTIHAVGHYTKKMMRVGGGKMPVWMLIQALANENWFNPQYSPEFAGQGIDESKILYPTYEEMRFMAYDAIICGATGLALSMHGTPTDGKEWQDVKRLVAELRGLHDALASPPADVEVEIAHADLGFTIWDGVEMLARRKGDKVYLFTANTAFDPARVTMRLSNVPSNCTAVVEAEGREAAVENGLLIDAFEPYAVHVYRLPAQA